MKYIKTANEKKQALNGGWGSETMPEAGAVELQNKLLFYRYDLKEVELINCWLKAWNYIP